LPCLILCSGNSPLLYTLCMIFFFNDTSTPQTYTLSLHDALPIWAVSPTARRLPPWRRPTTWEWCRTTPSARSARRHACNWPPARSEEHTSELQSRGHLVCRLLLEKKKQNTRRLRTSRCPHAPPLS